ncbi:MAG: DEAD/DEAH box helicase family protein [bacterium]|nr:DEAD/DEAH box helicase family protein [bacterium]
MANQTPEQIARDRIDLMLEKAGWAVQDKNKADPRAAAGIALREVKNEAGSADYVLFVVRDGRPIPCGIVEAKREDEAHRLSFHEKQAENYAKSKLKHIADAPKPFIYKSTGVITDFTNTKDPKPRWRRVFSFHRPETLAQWLKESQPLRARFNQMRPLQTHGLRVCQLKAITKLEKSFQKNKPKALIQMATGSGKTYTAVTSIYRLLKYAKAKRVLFLVDTRNLGEQAEQEFMSYTPAADNRTFTELYNVQRLRSRYVAEDSQVCISTIQRMYSILRSEELEESAEEENPNEVRITGRRREVEYNEKVPPEFFDFIVIDECHRSIYDVWKQVLDYFDAYLIGLTATPDKRTFGFFDENVVSEYSHEKAVADGVNVGNDTYTIETTITKNGAVIAAREFVDSRERLTRKKRWMQLDDEKVYTGKELDRDVVNPSQIRNVIRAFKNSLPELFPGRSEVPKTLIFAKTDSHAEDIIPIIREEFDEGNEFCRKITSKAKSPETYLNSFRNDYYPRIAVTVHMISAGTDVKPLECLLFMRDVSSRNYFEQMKGRGTRTLAYDDLKKVTPSANSAKTRYVLVDAVGASKSLKTDSRPLERKRGVPMKDLLYSIVAGARDDATFSSLASRLARLDRQLTTEEKKRFEELAGNKPVASVVNELLDAINPDKIEDEARYMFHIPVGATPQKEQLEKARAKLTNHAASTFYGDLNTFIENVRKLHEQIIDKVNIDQVEFAGWDRQAVEKAESVIADFRAYIEENRDEITALRIFYSQTYNGRELTYAMVKELLNIIKENKPALAPLAVWQAYEQVEAVTGKSPGKELTALVALVRRVTGIDAELTPYDGTVNRNFQEWVMKKHHGNAPKFNTEQMEWLRMIKEHIADSFHVTREDLELAPFNSKGGLGRMYQLFGPEMETIFDEMNEALSA